MPNQFQPGSMNYTQGFGASPDSVAFPHIDVRAPGAADNSYPIGKRWIDNVAGNAYTLVSYSPSNGILSASWTLLGAAAGNLNTLTTDDLTVVTPVAGNINLAGTGSLATTGSGATATVGLTGLTNHNVLLGAGTATITKLAPSATTGVALISQGAAADPAYGTVLVPGGGTGLTSLTPHALYVGNLTAAPTALAVGATGTVLGGVTGSDPAFTASPSVTGSVTAGTTLTATLGAITATNGNLVLGTAGNKILSTSVATTTTAGANSFGTVTLVGGTATVSTSAITTNSIVLLTRQTIGATGAAALGQISRGTISNGVSFVINALSGTDATALVATDVSNIGWMIIN